MLLAVDVHYNGSQGKVAGVCFESWRDAKPKRVLHSIVEDVEAYEPGRFYLRELPCIVYLVEEYSLDPEVIIIDGYVYLDDPVNPGLGMHLYNHFNGEVAVVGVAKKPFKRVSKNTEVFRGDSVRPLYVTAVGMALEEAKNKVLSMHGTHRLPTLLRAVDRACRKH